jgi:5'-nucleotidase
MEWPKMRPGETVVLLTNDDGIFSEGLLALEDALPASWDVYVVAPDRPRNATSHSLTLDGLIRVQEHGKKRFSTSGTPTDCVNIGVHRLMPRKPDLVLSGINIGANLCEDVTYSGTVAAALEARLLDIPSLALSLAARGEMFFGPAARIACELAGSILERGLPPGVLLNVNIPNLLDGSSERIRWTRLGHKHYGDCLLEERDEEGGTRFRFGADPMTYIDEEDDPNVDWKAVQAGEVSVTPLRLNMTDDTFLLALKQGYYGEGEPWTARS